tara:strand:- start:214 stop:1584 length:1371 start_codon:yes stop_codon:yes gene_type:complete
MAVNLPTNASDIVNRQKADIQNYLPNSNPFLKNGLLSSLIQSSGYRFFDMYQLLETVQKGLFLDNYADESVLNFWGNLVNVSLGKPTSAQGEVVFSSNQNGTLIPNGTLLSNDSITYTTLSDKNISKNNNTILQITQSAGLATIIFSGAHNLATGINIIITGSDQDTYNGSKSVTVVSEIEANFNIDINTISPATGNIKSDYYVSNINVQCSSNGVNTNRSSGASLSLQNPIVGINNNAFVSLGGLVGGTDTEEEKNYKSRIEDAWKNPVAGFNAQSIINQAKIIKGITRCFVLRATKGLDNGNYLKNNAGFVTVYCVKDKSESIITTTTDNANIKTSIMQIAPMNDVSNNIQVLSLEPIDINFNFSNIIPNSTTMETSIKENIRQFFRSKNIINGVESNKLNDGNIDINDINLTILKTVDTITGQSLQSYTLTTPLTNISIGDGQIAIEGDVIFS